ncbi:MAG: DUF2778 domain-containing protein [Burkholderiales bacterium]|nr:DUF2778 domain-containing protein [Burkholderiales bacterium]
MIECTFELNNKAMSTLKCGAISFSAFSGLGSKVNQRASVCMAGSGAIPRGTYYIFDRQSGGLLGSLRDMFNDHSNWFALLYTDDNKIDDEAYCDHVIRGNFRLHPKGVVGISKGCITIESKTDFQKLKTMLKSSAPVSVPGSTLKAYGKVVVR